MIAANKLSLWIITVYVFLQFLLFKWR